MCSGIPHFIWMWPGIRVPAGRCSFLCADYDPLCSYQPEDIHFFKFWIEISVGIEGEVGEELFQVCVCSPKWIENQLKESCSNLGLYTIIMSEYNYDNLCSILERLFCIEGKDYNEISNKLGRIGVSEHDPYWGDLKDVIFP